MKFTIRLFCLLAIMIAAASTTSEPPDDGPKIKFGWGWTIWGSSYWSIYADDTVIYRGQQNGADPKMPNWKWVDRDIKYGFAEKHIPGAYAKAVAIADAALKDPILKHKPKEYLCFDAGYDEYWLDPNSDQSSVAMIGCLPDMELSAKDRQFVAWLSELRKALYNIVLPPSK